MNQQSAYTKDTRRGAARVGRIGIGLLVIASLLLASACGGGGPGGKRVAAVTHPWINPPHDIDKKAVTLSPWLVYRVHPDVLKESIDELKTEPYIQISPNMASHYTKSDLRVPAEMRPFLIRGLDAGDSEITVIQSMLGLWVKAVGGDMSHINYQPLVVLIDPTPIEIFVTVEPQG